MEEAQEAAEEAEEEATKKSEPNGFTKILKANMINIGKTITFQKCM